MCVVSRSADSRGSEEGGGSTTRQIAGQRQLDVQVVNIFPPHAPSLLDLFTLEWSLKAEETLGGRRA